MIESKIEIKTFGVQAQCECGGVYQQTGLCYNSLPPQYPHRCNLCGKEETFIDQYPKITYESC